jgi:cytidylate kinase
MSTVIAIDGPAGSGKSTISRRLANALGFLYLDTGAMYRAVALEAQRKGMDGDEGKRLGELCRAMDLQLQTDDVTPRWVLDGEDISETIRSPEMDMLSSRISAVKEVREAMTELQRRLARGVDVVAEGRDMGTVVFPDAAHKFFLTASAEIRAERRYRERVSRGENISKEAVARDMKRRDSQDQSRDLAPLAPAGDATVIDSTGLTIDQVLRRILLELNRTSGLFTGGDPKING